MSIPKETLLHAYRTMKTIREFEERVNAEIMNGQIPGFTHLYTGQEANAVGVCAHLDKSDTIISTHRGHGHCIAKGADHLARRIREVAAEHDIPMIENKPLTRMLYDEIDVDQVIPVAHWEIVAEIISFVFDLRNNKKRAAPQGSTLRTDPY